MNRRDVDEWLRLHTFRCAIGRVTPEQCLALRSRPTIKECEEHARHAVPPRPRACEECREWQEKIRSIGVQKEHVQTKTCKTCGKELPLSEFHRDSKGCKERKASCKDCLKQHKRNLHKQRDISAKNDAFGRDVSAPAAEYLETRACTTKVPSALMLNLADYPDLIGKINEAARDEMRTPEMQAMWIIKMYFDAHNNSVEEEKAS